MALRPRLTTGLLLSQSTEGGAPAHVHADMSTSKRVKTYSKAVPVSSIHPSVPWPGTGHPEAMKMTVAKPGRDVLGFSLSSRTARRRTRICRETLEDGIGDALLEAPQRLPWDLPSAIFLR